jgi:A/G-specific adenine glycosylase
MNGGQTLPEPVDRACRHSEKSCLEQDTVTSFQHTIYTRYHSNPRPMPWRETDNPYHILISEIMLQQTQVERVKSKYAQFLEAFPSLNDLAAAPLTDVLSVWQGLGYNRRAIALKRCAEEIQTRFDGQFPASIQDLESLPGIGHYTARALAAFAFGIPEALIETNIRSVFIHFFFHGREKVHDREIMPLVAVTLDRNNPRAWYYALMDFGVHLKQLHPNPGRQSRHHTQQSRFEGSNRQLRSRLLRAVLSHPGITVPEMTGMFEADQSAVEKNLSDMEREGFIRRTGECYMVQDTKRG